jgi:hypothetical protein
VAKAARAIILVVAAVTTAAEEFQRASKTKRTGSRGSSQRGTAKVDSRQERMKNRAEERQGL